MNNISPVFKAETASDLKNDVFKIGLGLCVYLPLCSFFGITFLEFFKLFAKNMWGIVGNCVILQPNSIV